MTLKEYTTKKNKIAGLSLLSLVAALGLMIAAIFNDQPVSGILIILGLLGLAGLVFGSLKLNKLEESYRKNPNEINIQVNTYGTGMDEQNIARRITEGLETEVSPIVEDIPEEVPPRKSRFDKYR